MFQPPMRCLGGTAMLYSEATHHLQPCPGNSSPPAPQPNSLIIHTTPIANWLSYPIPRCLDTLCPLHSSYMRLTAHHFHTCQNHVYSSHQLPTITEEVFGCNEAVGHVGPTLQGRRVSLPSKGSNPLPRTSKDASGSGCHLHWGGGCNRHLQVASAMQHTSNLLQSANSRV